MEQILLQYGAIGAICLYLIWRDNSRDNKIEKILIDIKEVLKTQVDQTAVLEESLDYERKHSDGYRNTLINKIEDVGKKIENIHNQLSKCEDCGLKK